MKGCLLVKGELPFDVQLGTFNSRAYYWFHIIISQYIKNEYQNWFIEYRTLPWVERDKELFVVTIIWGEQIHTTAARSGLIGRKFVVVTNTVSLVSAAAWSVTPLSVTAGRGRDRSAPITSVKAFFVRVKLINIVSKWSLPLYRC